MQQWTRLKEDEADFDLAFALVVDAELFRLDSVVRWLDAADGRIKRAAVERPRPRLCRCRGCDGDWRCGDELPRAARRLQDLRPGHRPRSTPCATIDLSVDAGVAGGGDGPERVGQEHAAHHRRQPRGADQR